MTYQSDPTRWTESPGDAPELLRSAIRACADEAPSDFQMRSLALKLAVVGSGAAVIASAASASAASSMASAGVASAGVASAGTLAAGSSSVLTLAKVAAVSVALIGAAATGAVLVRRDAAPRDVARHRAPAIAAPVSQAPQPVADERVAARVAPERAAEAEQDAPVAASAAPATPTTPTQIDEPARARASAGDTREIRRSERRESRHHARAAARSVTRPQQEAAASQVELPRELSRGASARGASAGELELLHHARAALSVRPLSAFALTEQHRATYPNGVFTQERDALAVEALLRAGDLDRARSLAERFIERHPSSPHAHRFRETMKLQ